jgi:hypothetical protein
VTRRRGGAGRLLIGADQDSRSQDD